MTKVLAISGSLRKGSFNTGLLRAAQRHAPEGVEIEIFDDLESLAPYNEDREGSEPESVVELKRRIREADALLIATPEFKHHAPRVRSSTLSTGAHGPTARSRLCTASPSQ